MQYKLLINSLILLGSSFEEQSKYLPKFVDIQDDVVSGFENAFSLLPQLIENNMLSTDSIVSILRLYNRIQWCSNNIDFDDFSNTEWNKVREMARETLTILDEPMKSLTIQ